MTNSDLPAVSVGLPVLGPHASPASIEQVAVAADRLGYRSVSITERILLPADPKWQQQFGLPDWPVFDAIEILTWVAAKTQHLMLRTDIIVPLFQQPVVLARRLATLDHLSGGRVEVGVGLGWLPEEFEATGVPADDRAGRFEECITAIRACWGPDPVSFDGKHYRIPLSKIGPKPLRGSIPIAIGAVSRPASDAAARLGDGFTMAFRDWAAIREQLRWYRDAGGSGPVILRGGPMLVDAEFETPPQTWTPDHVVESLAVAAAEGIDEFAWDLNIASFHPDEQVELLEALAIEIGLESRSTIAGSIPPASNAPF